MYYIKYAKKLLYISNQKISQILPLIFLFLFASFIEFIGLGLIIGCGFGIGLGLIIGFGFTIGITLGATCLTISVLKIISTTGFGVKFEFEISNFITKSA